MAVVSDIWDDPSAVVWARHVLEEMAPNMAESAACISLVPSDGVGDVKFWVELGAMICMDKPIVVVAMGDTVIPPKLALVADEVVRLPEGVNPAGGDALAAAVRRVTGA